MKREEYIETVAYNGHMINVGIDDPGQQYFLETINEEGKLIEIGCGAYNNNYMDQIEYWFGSSTLCSFYAKKKAKDEDCERFFDHGYCGNCPYNQLKRNQKGIS